MFLLNRQVEIKNNILNVLHIDNINITEVQLYDVRNKKM